MPTHLAIDDELLTEAQKVGGHRTKEDTVNAALESTSSGARKRSSPTSSGRSSSSPIR